MYVINERSEERKTIISNICLSLAYINTYCYTYYTLHKACVVCTQTIILEANTNYVLELRYVTQKLLKIHSIQQFCFEYLTVLLWLAGM